MFLLFIIVQTNAENAYQKAQEAAEDLPATHPTRLGLALNFSVFYYEIKNENGKACELAKKVSLSRTCNMYCCLNTVNVDIFDVDLFSRAVNSSKLNLRKKVATCILYCACSFSPNYLKATIIDGYKFYRFAHTLYLLFSEY